MQSTKYRQALWHAENTMPMTLALPALAVLYLWLRPSLMP